MITEKNHFTSFLYIETFLTLRNLNAFLKKIVDRAREQVREKERNEEFRRENIENTALLDKCRIVFKNESEQSLLFASRETDRAYF